MFQANQQQVARIAEETVTVLKDLEVRLEILRNDLAALCQSIGHPQAAQVALTPRTLATSGVPQSALGAFGSPLGSFGPFGQGLQGPYGQVTPYGLQGSFGQQTPLGSPMGVSPFGLVPFTAGISPLAASPFGVSPWASSIYAQGIPPLAAVNPWVAQGQTPFGVNPFAANIPRF